MNRRLLKMLDEAIENVSEDTFDEEILTLDAHRKMTITGWHIQDDVMKRSIIEIEGLLSDGNLKEAKKKTEEIIHDIRNCLQQVEDVREAMNKREAIYRGFLSDFEKLRNKNKWS